MKGIILAGGSGTRLYPLTLAVSKQLLPVYDKPMIYYPLSILMMAKVREVLIISDERNLPAFEKFFGNGNELGMEISYKIQEKPIGIADAFRVGEEFIGEDNVALVLGDNVIHGFGMEQFLEKASKLQTGAMIFGYEISDPRAYGVVEIDENGKALSIEEKPQNPKSNLAVIGLYFYDNKVVEIAKKLTPSKRGELEITDVTNDYLKRGALDVIKLGRGVAWFDTGSPDRLLETAQYVKAIQTRQGIQIACIEEIAYNNGWITKEQVKKLAEKYSMTEYGKYLEKCID